MRTKLKISETAIFIFCLLFSAEKAQAYLDPGSGSYMLQLIVAGIAGFLFSMKMFWRHISNFFLSIFYRNKPKQSAGTEKENDNK